MNNSALNGTILEMTLTTRITDRSYRLDPDEHLGDDLRRVALGRVDDALEQIERVSEEPDRAVHEARKDVKRIRSAIRLIRDGIGKATYERENALFRAAGRLLGPARDCEVKIETLRAESDRFARAVSRDSLRAWVDALRRERAEQIVRLVDERADEVLSILETGRAAICDWPVHELDDGVIEAGLRRYERRAGKRLDAVLSEPTPESLHAWRRRAKDVRHHLEIMRDIGPDETKERLELAHELTDILGDLNNLAVLRFDAAKREAILDRGELDAIGERLAERMTALVESALDLGARLHGDERIERR